jgi:hypothetical protein
VCLNGTAAATAEAGGPADSITFIRDDWFKKQMKQREQQFTESRQLSYDDFVRLVGVHTVLYITTNGRILFVHECGQSVCGYLECGRRPTDTTREPVAFSARDGR